jgi:hypothetical protein
MNKRKHLLTSVINSGGVTVFTSFAMTLKNTGGLEFMVWLPNWLISWAIVCTYVYFIAPIVSAWAHSKEWDF